MSNKWTKAGQAEEAMRRAAHEMIAQGLHADIENTITQATKKTQETLGSYMADLEKRISSFEDDINWAKLSSALTQRVLSDMICARHVPKKETEHGKSVDWDWYSDQFKIIKDMELFLNGKILSDEEVTSGKEVLNRKYWTEKAKERIKACLYVGKEAGLKRSVELGELVRFVKDQGVSAGEWDERMGPVMQDAYVGIVEALDAQRKELLIGGMCMMLTNSGGDALESEELPEQLRQMFNTTFKKQGFVWTEEILNWIPEAREAAFAKAEEACTERLTAAVEFVGDFGNYTHEFEMVTQAINSKNYHKAFGACARIMEEVGRLRHEAGVTGDYLEEETSDTSSSN